MRFGGVHLSVCLNKVKLKDRGQRLGQSHGSRSRSDFWHTAIGSRGSAFPVADDLIDNPY